MTQQHPLFWSDNLVVAPHNRGPRSNLTYDTSLYTQFKTELADELIVDTSSLDGVVYLGDRWQFPYNGVTVASIRPSEGFRRIEYNSHGHPLLPPGPSYLETVDLYDAAGTKLSDSAVTCADLFKRDGCKVAAYVVALVADILGSATIDELNVKYHRSHPHNTLALFEGSGDMLNEFIAFVKWVFIKDNLRQDIKSTLLLPGVIYQFRRQFLEERAMSVESVLLRGVPGTGDRFCSVDGVSNSHTDVNQCRFVFTCVEGPPLINVTMNEAGIPRDSRAGSLLRVYAALYNSRTRLLPQLNKRFGMGCALTELEVLSNNELETLADSLKLYGVPETSRLWTKLITFARQSHGISVCHVENFDSDWIHSLLATVPRTQADELYHTIERSRTLNVEAVDIEQFARTSLPANSFVESVTALKNGRVRVVLKEPVRPVLVQYGGKTYMEEEPGTVFNQEMVVAAFDLDLRCARSGFPDAYAYADRDCTRAAIHPNIQRGAGSVCLGDINRGEMTAAELQARGGVALPSIGDFVQMLRQCNLDSAYNRDRETLLQRPNSVSKGDWNKTPWNIPGLRLVETQVFVPE